MIDTITFIEQIIIILEFMRIRNCYNCGYCKENYTYCADLDCEVDPNEPICSNENYYA